jgi:hypothetical protein
MRPSLALLLLAAACSPRAVTPPSRTFVIDGPGAPPVGKSDVQLDAASISTLWGPELVGGNARLRQTVSPGVTMELDGGVLRVTNAGDGPARNAYTGRLGVLMHGLGGRLALGAGLGGGVSRAAGSWGAADVHGAIAGAHRYIRPILGGGFGYAAPFGNRTFDVREPDDKSPTTLRLPRNLIAQIDLGLELGPRDKAFLLGGTLSRFWLRDNSEVGDTGGYDHDDFFVALGIGARFTLD